MSKLRYLDEIIWVHFTDGTEPLQCTRADVQPTVSPSAIKAWSDSETGCPRRLAFDDIHERTETPSQKLGVELHAFGEAYQRDGKMPDNTRPMGRLFAEGIPHLPKPKAPGFEVEREFHIIHNGVCYHGFIDLLKTDALQPQVWDYKTTGDYIKYAIKAADMPADVQNVLYALAGMLLSPQTKNGPTTAANRWIYFNKDSKICHKPHLAIIGKSHCIAALDALHTHAQSIAQFRSTLINQPHETAEQRKPLIAVINATIEHKPQHCFTYNKMCDYSPICKKYIRPMPNPDGTSTKIEQLIAAKKAKQAAEDAAAQTAAPAAAAPPAVATVTDISTRVAALQNKTQTAPVNPPEVTTALAAAAADIANPPAAVEEKPAEEKPKATRAKATAPKGISSVESVGGAILAALMQGVEVTYQAGRCVIRLLAE